MIGPESFRKENVHRLVVSVEVIDKVSFTSQQSTGIKTADASGDSIGGRLHCPGNGAAVRCVEVKI